MPNWSSHLPRVGSLVLSAAIAAAAYGVYTGQPSSSVNSSGESVADFPTLSVKPEAGPPTHGGGKPAQDQAVRRPSGHAGVGPGFATRVSAAQPTTSSPQVEPEAQAVKPEIRKPATHATPPQPSPAPDDDDALDHELQRVIDQGLSVAPKSPKSPPSDDGPVDGTPVSDDPADLIEEPGAPVPGPQTTPTAPGSEAPPAAPEAPPADPASPAAPVDDTALDDTAAGGLDDTDLGTPVDATDQNSDAIPPPAPPPSSDTAPSGAG
jgi:hypothetical protein